MWIPSLSQHLLITTLIKDQPLTPLFVAHLGREQPRRSARCSAWLAVRLYRREAILG